MSVFTYMLVLTRHGMFVTEDSASYLGAAHNLLAGRGLTTPAPAATTTLHLAQSLRAWGRQPYVEFGPLYPVAIAFVSVLGASLVQAARVVNAASVALLALAGFLIARRLQKDPYLLPVGVGLFMIFAPTRAEPPSDRMDAVRLGTNVLSEPLTYGLAALSLYLYLRFLQDGSQRILALSLLAAGLAATARFQLLSLVLAEGLVLTLVNRRPLRRRLMALAQAIPFGLAPFVLFELLALLVFHEHAGEPLHHHGSAHTLRTLCGWLFGGLFGTPLATAVTLAVVTGCLASLWWSGSSTRSRLAGPDLWPWVAVLVVYVAGQIAFLWLTKTWFNAYMYIDQRILGSSQQGLYLILVTLVCAALAVQAGRRLRPARWMAAYWGTGVPIGAIALVAGLPGHLPSVLAQRLPGPGGGPPELAALRRQPNLPVFTDDPAYIYLVTAHASVLAPTRTFLTLDEPNRQLPRDLATMGEVLSRCGGEVIIRGMLSTNVANDLVLRTAVQYGAQRAYPDGLTIVAVDPPQGISEPGCMEDVAGEGR